MNYVALLSFHLFHPMDAEREESVEQGVALRCSCEQLLVCQWFVD